MTYNILDYGAVSGNENINTVAIQNAIDDCTTNGGGTVIIPSGKFISGTLYLKSNVELHLEMGAELQASTNREDYNALDVYPENYDIPGEGWDARHFIIAYKAENVAITGLGTINGSADTFFDGEVYQLNKPVWGYGIKYQKGFKPRMEKSDNPRPGQCIVFICCKNVRIIDITVVKSPCWCIFLHGCENVQVRGYKSFNDRCWANTDGLDIDTCKNVTVSDCIMDNGDDAIAIRCDSKHLYNGLDTCENITISNCVFSSSSSVFRIGVGVGVIRNVHISNIVIPRAGVGFTISTQYWPDCHVCLEDMFIHDIITDNTGIPFEIFATLDCSIKNLSLHNFRSKCYKGAIILAKDSGKFSNVTLKDMQLSLIPSPFSFPILDMNGNNLLLNIQNTKDVKLECVSKEIPEEYKPLFEDEL